MGMIDFSNPFVIYILCGIVFNFIFDVLISLMGKSLEEKQIKEEDLRLTLIQKIYVTFLWPIHLIVFIKGLFQTTNEKTDD